MKPDENQDTRADALVSFVTEYASAEEIERNLHSAYGRYVPGSAAREARNWMWTHEDWWERDTEPDEDDTEEDEENDE